MNKKVFTILLLAVFMLAQFSFVSAAPATAAVATIATTLNNPAYIFPAATIDLNWSFTFGAATATTSYLYIFERTTGAAWTAANPAQCAAVATIPASPIGTQSGKYTFAFTTPIVVGNTVEFLLYLDDVNSCATAATDAAASAATSTSVIIKSVAGTAVLTGTPAVATFSAVGVDATKLAYSVTGMPGTSVDQYLLLWTRAKASPANAWSNAAGYCVKVVDMPSTITNIGTYKFDTSAYADQDVVEFYFTVSSSNACATSVIPATSVTPLGETFIDAIAPTRITLNPPSLDASPFTAQRVACNTFEMWSLGSDNWIAAAPPVVPVGGGYSGLKSWNQLTTGTSAPPTPLGTAPDLLSWQYTFPATASGGWQFSLQLTDAVGNSGPASLLRDPALLTNILPSELENCKDFSDTAGNANAIYIRYLADLGLISGNPDGTSGINKTLTRAEAAALFEKANNYILATLPKAPSTACTFTDVNASDWFSGWVWQACADGFMSGIGGGKFDPSNTLTRGQVVTILNNIDVANNGSVGSFLAPFSPTYRTILNSRTAIWTISSPIRTLAWTDVFISDYYAIPIQRAYGWGVADSTGLTTFSPNQPILRGEFEKMMYRALSRVK